MRPIIAGATFLTLLFLWPVLTHFSTHLTSHEDGLLISYLIHWVAHAIATGQNVYQVPFFHPFANTLAYSDPFFSTGLLSIPLLWLTSNLVIIHNIHLVIGTITTFMSMYFLSKLVTQSKAAALISALIFTFSSLHFMYVVHLHTYLIAGLPMSLYFFLTWLKTHRWHHLTWAAVAFLYQALNAPMTGFFVAFIFLILLIQKNIRHQLWLKKEIVLAVGLGVALICGVLYRPYFQVSREFNYTRSIRDTAHFAHSLNYFWQPESLLLLGLLASLWYRQRKIITPSAITADKPVLSLKTQVVIAAVGAILMLGPALKINDQTFKLFGFPIPLPYAVLYYVIPGFQAFRTSSRWITLFNFGLSLIIGSLLSRTQLKRYQIWFISITLVGFFWLTQVPSLQLFPIPQTLPTIYEQVKARPETVLAEFPVFSWGMAPFQYLEADRYQAQIFHHKRVYNGATGFTPPARLAEWDDMWLNFPASSTIDLLREAGVELVLVDFSIYDHLAAAGFNYANHPSPTGQEMRSLVENQSRLQTLSCTETACLYTIQP